MSLTIVGIIGSLVMLLLLFARIPVGFAMMLVGFAGFSYVVSPEAGYSLLVSDLFFHFSSFNLTCIPLFILMGEIAFHSGITKRLFAAAYQWVGQLRGGLAMATMGACTAFGAICGDPVATAATMGTVALPEMKNYKYDAALATSTIAAGSTIASMIPPSIVFIIYGIMTQQSIGKLFIAGITVGILQTFLLCVTIYIMTTRNPHWGPAGPRVNFKEKLLFLPKIWEILVVFGIVMGGLYAGWFTPMEAGAAGAGSILLIALARREITWKGFTSSILETTHISCMVMIILAGAIVFGRFLAITQIPFGVANWVVEMGWGPNMVTVMILLIYFVAGFFIDILAFMMLTIPIFFPILVSIGIDPIWFGVVLLLCMGMGALTPPVGMQVYVVKGVAPDVRLETIFKGIFYFLPTYFILIVILWFFPEIALFLPSLMG